MNRAIYPFYLSANPNKIKTNLSLVNVNLEFYLSANSNKIKKKTLNEIQNRKSFKKFDFYI